jgi:thymidylate synthase
MLKRLTDTAKHRDGRLLDEHQYLRLIEDVLEYGERIEGRNGVTLSIKGAAMHFSLSDSVLPLFTTKRVAWKTCLRELLWFISGNTDARQLERAGAHIWSANATREFLDSRGLSDQAVGDLGPVYGHQWRHYNAPYTRASADYEGQGIDQLAAVIGQLREPSQRASRRIILTAWNPGQVAQMALPPCHILAQFHVSPPNLLSCSVYQRSADMGLGVPFNVASYGLLTHLLAHHCGLEAHEFIHHIGDCHMYKSHVTALRSQLARKATSPPRLRICARHVAIEQYTEADFEVDGYLPAPRLHMTMSA